MALTVVAGAGYGGGPEQGSGSGDPYTPVVPIPGDWQSRVNWPVEPSTGAPISVTPATFSANLSSGNHLRLANGNYGSLFVTDSMTDIRIDAVNPGGAVFNGYRNDGTRIHLEGLDIQTGDVNSDMTQSPQDVLSVNCRFQSASALSLGTPTIYIGAGGPRNGFLRCAFVTCTIQNDGDGWPFLYQGTNGQISADFILANCYINASAGTANNDALRMAHTSRLIYLDNYLESGAGNQWRMHNEIEDILAQNNVTVGGAGALFWDIAGDGVGGGYARRALVNLNEFHDQFGQDPFSAMSNNGSVQDAEATDNNHYSVSQSSGTSAMDQGPTPWITYTNNIRRVYQAPPARTQGHTW